MKKITINLSLTKAQWALLSLGIKYVVPLLPKMSWDELEKIDNLINKKLDAVVRRAELQANFLNITKYIDDHLTFAKNYTPPGK